MTCQKIYNVRLKFNWKFVPMCFFGLTYNIIEGVGVFRLHNNIYWNTIEKKPRFYTGQNPKVVRNNYATLSVVLTAQDEDAKLMLSTTPNATSSVARYSTNVSEFVPSYVSV